MHQNSSITRRAKLNSSGLPEALSGEERLLLRRSSSHSREAFKKGNYGKIPGVFPQPLSNNGMFAVRRGQQQKWKREGACPPPRPWLRPPPPEAPPSEVLLVEDEFDVGLGVRQALFLQGLPQLGGAAEEHAHFGSVGKKRGVTDETLGIRSGGREAASPGVLRGDIGELVVPVRLPVEGLLFEAGYRVVLRLVVNAEVSRLARGGGWRQGLTEPESRTSKRDSWGKTLKNLLLLPAGEVDVVAQEVRHPLLRHLALQGLQQVGEPLEGLGLRTQPVEVDLAVGGESLSPPRFSAQGGVL